MTQDTNTNPKARAVDACLAAAVDAGSLTLGLRDYERITGISARMLVYHFGNKSGLESALLAHIESQLLDHVLLRTQDAVPYEVAKEFAGEEFKRTRLLLRLLLGRALAGDLAAANVFRGERERWRAALRPTAGSTAEAEEGLFTLVGGALDALLNDLGDSQ